MRHWLGGILISFWTMGSLSAQEFTSGGHCVAWRTNKTMFLFSKETPIGMNCKVQTTLKGEGEQKQLEVVIPIKGFDSKNADRDADIFTILKGPQQPDLLFQSEALSNNRLGALVKEGGSVQGQLTIGGKAYPISFTIKSQKLGEGAVFLGTFQGTFTQFDIEPPRVVGGLVAKVDDSLDLLFQFQSSEIKGWSL